MKKIIAASILLSFGLLAATMLSIRTIDQDALNVARYLEYPQVLDRYGEVLSVSYQNQFNIAHQVSVEQIPSLVKDAFVLSEDKRFFEHRGVDWQARANALYQAIKTQRFIRGARTITEQVIGMVHPRKRTIWSRWIEGFEAQQFEKSFSKAAILQFYFNQVPYGSRRRGIVEASRYYFDRDLSTLNRREQLALVVMVRSPEKFNPRKNPRGLNIRIDQLAERLRANGQLSADEELQIKEMSLDVAEPRQPIEAGHFVRYIRSQTKNNMGVDQGVIRTTLDGSLQQQIQQTLVTLLNRFSNNQIRHGAVLVVDHQKGEVLAWVNDRAFSSVNPESQIDAVRTVRQPGSTLKPFVYAEALEQGWDAATILSDRDLIRPVGSGLHRYRNYSRKFHGDVRLREALGSSLNIPAIQAAEFIGRANLLKVLRRFGFKTLRRGSDYYGEGLALGNGEVSLFELVHAYSILARGGVDFQTLSIKKEYSSTRKLQRVLSQESSSIISNILADPYARILEFGRGGVLQFPTETAVKTGTSSGYRDLWAVGYSSRFTVGVWMGNLSRVPTKGLTSTQAPALVMRTVFSFLEKRWDGSPLPLRGDLVSRTICAETGLPPTDDLTQQCRKLDELFDNRQRKTAMPGQQLVKPEILVPSPGIIIARDPRIPDQFEKLGFQLNSERGISHVRWYLDDKFVGEAVPGGARVDWALEQGEHRVYAEVLLTNNTQDLPVTVGPVGFVVR